MNNILKRVRHENADTDPREALNAFHPRHSHATMAWVAAGSAVLGAGASIYGSNMQSKANDKANAANRASIEAADRAAWNNYLLTRGLNAGGSAATGQIPMGAAPVNTRLPLWANIRRPTIPNGAGARPNVPFLIKHA